MNVMQSHLDFDYNLVLSKAAVDFLTQYRLHEGEVFEQHGPVMGPRSSWNRVDIAGLEALLVIVEASSLPEDAKALAKRLIESAARTMKPL